MSKRLVTFQLDIGAAAAVIGDMSMPLVRQSANAINARAQSMAGSITTKPPEFKVKAEIGTIKRGRRAIGTVQANYDNPRDSYVAHTALRKAKDAGRLN